MLGFWSLNNNEILKRKKKKFNLNNMAQDMTISNISLEISPSDPDQTAPLGEIAPLGVASNYAVAG